MTVRIHAGDCRDILRPARPAAAIHRPAESPRETARRILPGMSRYPKTLFGPAGVCPACGRYCQGLHQVGKTCYHCRAAPFSHRSEWDFSDCPECAGGGCGQCHYTGVAAQRRA